MKLPQLQNLIKRDPSAYREEFLQQKRAFEAEARLFTLRPSRDSPRFLELVTFMSHVLPCYTKEESLPSDPEDGSSMQESFPRQLTALLEESAVVMRPATRKALVHALILLRNRGLVDVGREGGREGGKEGGREGGREGGIRGVWRGQRV
jgi:protein SDA1